jgi:hypothetical protein
MGDDMATLTRMAFYASRARLERRGFALRAGSQSARASGASMVAGATGDADEGDAWLENTPAARAAWEHSPVLPALSGDDLVRALVRCGWIPLERSEHQLRLKREGRVLVVPCQDPLVPALVLALCIRAKVSPRQMIAAVAEAVSPGLLPGKDATHGES